MAMNVAMMAAVPTKIGPTWASAEALLLLLEMTTNAKRNYHVNTTSTHVMSLVNTKKRTKNVMGWEDLPEGGATYFW